MTRKRWYIPLRTSSELSPTVLAVMSSTFSMPVGKTCPQTLELQRKKLKTSKIKRPISPVIYSWFWAADLGSWSTQSRPSSTKSFSNWERSQVALMGLWFCLENFFISLIQTLNSSSKSTRIFVFNMPTLSPPILSPTKPRLLLQDSLKKPREN